MNNKIIKTLLRYLKEKKQYKCFKENLINIYNENLSSFLVRMRYSFREINWFLITINLQKGDEANSPFLNYICGKYKKEIIELFENFLEEQNIKNIFLQSINKRFIKHIYEIYNYELNNKTIRNKKDFLYENVTPIAFITYAFKWTDTAYQNTSIITIPQKNEVFWSELNGRWQKVISKYLQEKY